MTSQHLRLVRMVRTIESDSPPDGWPAIRMRDVSGLADAVEAQSGLSSASVLGGWQPIQTAPKDGTLIDVWCKPPPDDDERPDARVRLTNISWHNADSIFPHTGWIRVCDDGNWDAIESDEPTCDLALPKWIPTHWIPIPNPPNAKCSHGAENH